MPIQPTGSIAAPPARTAHADRSAADPPSRPPVTQRTPEARPNPRLEQVAQSVQFSVDEETGRTVVKIVDPATREVLRQIPAEELLAVARALGRMQGLLVEQEA
jgi:flagellar protein FlaG